MRPMDLADMEGTGDPVVPLPESRGGDPRKALVRELEGQVAQLKLQMEQAARNHEREVRVRTENAYQQGLKDGTSAGEASGRAIAQAAAEARLAEIERAVQSRLQAVESRIDFAILDWDSRAAELAMALARRIVGEVCEIPGAAAPHVARIALRKLGSEFRVVVRCHPQDLRVLESERDLWNGRGGSRRVELVEDESVGRGGVVVETDSGTIDARIPRLTESVERALAEAVEAENEPGTLP